ncbi:MAG: hypothetical protein GTN76_09725 [Candidatus Aenigmarchaeota archaeon]|nr:hypothetical protein [Candidatus Aenigmarchaeota archaeon]
MHGKKIQIRISFEGEDADRLEAVRKAQGVVHYTELVRVLVSQAYKRLKPIEQGVG